LFEQFFLFLKYLREVDLMQAFVGIVDKQLLQAIVL